MAAAPKKYAEQFRDLDRLRIITEQEGKVANFERARTGLTDFWTYCSRMRAAFMAGERCFQMEDERFREFIQECKRLFLVSVPEEVHEQLRLESYRTASRLAEGWRDRLGDMQILALAELDLKVLMALTLELASQSYVGEIRLPAWDRTLNEVNKDIDETCEAWQGLTSAVESLPPASTSR